MAQMGKQPTQEDYLACRTRPSTWRVMHQRWSHLLFLHWRVPKEILQNLLPERLAVDTFEGNAYIGIVPFYMSGVRPVGCPSVPGISNFPELNLRTYVYDTQTGVPGVWFFSLDAYQYLAVQIARKLFSLPYHYSKIHFSAREDATTEVEFKCRANLSVPRVLGFQKKIDHSEVSDNRREESRFKYRVHSESFQAEPGSLEFFLVERYVLFSTSADKLYMGQVHHEPYPLQQVHDCEFDTKLVTWYSDALHTSLEEINNPHKLYSPGVWVDIHNIQQV